MTNPTSGETTAARDRYLATILAQTERVTGRRPTANEYWQLAAMLDGFDDVSAAEAREIAAYLSRVRH